MDKSVLMGIYWDKSVLMGIFGTHIMGIFWDVYNVKKLFI